MPESMFQMIRFLLIGAAGNAIAFGIYLCLTGLEFNIFFSMTIVYFSTVMTTFYFNKNWTFRVVGNEINCLRRYFLLYSLFYLINLIILYYFVENLQFSHQYVQGITIIVFAILIFVAQKYWVFRLG
jgi:putative flippase GtrA